MELIYSGKTKDVYQLESNRVLLQFKDDVTGKDGVFDPGANSVGLTIDGIGKSGLRLSAHFFKMLSEKGIATHYISSNIEKAQMEVKKANPIGKGLEVICRYKAVGSFYKRYQTYCSLGQDLDALVEITLKDDEKGDPVISKATLENLLILNSTQYKELEALTKTIAGHIKGSLEEKNLDLYDIKLEFGYDEEGNLMLIDELSAGNMRVYQNEEYIEPLKLEKLFFDN